MAYAPPPWYPVGGVASSTPRSALTFGAGADKMEGKSTISCSSFIPKVASTLRALAYVVTERGSERFQIAEICEKVGIPEPFTRKVFQDLVQVGFPPYPPGAGRRLLPGRKPRQDLAARRDTRGGRRGHLQSLRPRVRGMRQRAPLPHAPPLGRGEVPTARPTREGHPSGYRRFRGEAAEEPAQNLNARGRIALYFRGF